MTDAHPDDDTTRILAERLPGFWAFFKRRNPQFQIYGQPDGPPIGAMSYHVIGALGPTIAAYVAEHGCGHRSDCAVHSCNCGGAL